MAAKKKTPAKAGDVTTIVGAVRGLINHLSAKSWLEALGDVQAIFKEVWAGFGVPQVSLASLKLDDDCCSDEAIQKLCKDMEGCCTKVEECGGDEKKLAKITLGDGDADAPVPAPQAIGPWAALLAPLMLQAIQAIINGLLKKEKQPA